jgi:tRNA(fMet)-specific endonuclease VapC
MHSIAAHAIALQVMLMTNNTKDFNRYPELKIENWLD